MARIILLVDYRSGFWSSTKNLHTTSSLDVRKMCNELERFGHSVEVLSFSKLDLSRSDLESTFVIYTSSEDVGAHYKRYVEAKVFGLRMRGAYTIPEPELLLAHHDKVMMESVRHARLGDASGQPVALTFGSLEEFVDARILTPMVIKPAAGAGSRGVSLVSTREQAVKAARRLTRTLDMPGALFEVAKRWRRRSYIPRSLHRRSIVLQELLPGLSGDYKVLRYGRRFYVLARENRPNDFRASGGGRLNYNPHESMDVTPILEAAAEWSDAIGSPFCSLDVAYNPQSRVEPTLIEFQCVNFGPATAESSTGYFAKGGDGWERFEELCNLEAVMAEATSEFIGKRLGIEGDH